LNRIIYFIGNLFVNIQVREGIIFRVKVLKFTVHGSKVHGSPFIMETKIWQGLEFDGYNGKF